MESDSASRVLVIAPQPFYQDRGTPIAIGYVLKSLTELGYEVDLLTYPIGASPEMPGVRYVRVANPLRFKSIPVSFSWKKLFLDVLIAYRLTLLAASGRYHYIHAVEEAAFLAVVLRFRHKTPVVYDMASSIPEQLALRRLFRFGPILWVCRWLEKWLLSSVDAVVASAGLERKVRELAPLTPVREWLYPAKMRWLRPEQLECVRAACGLESDDHAVVYTGTFEAYQGIPELLQAAPAILRECPNAMFILVGAKDESQVTEMISSLPIAIRPRFRIEMRVPRESVDGYLQMAAVLVSPRAKGGNVPLKLFDYLATAQPIVATDIDAHRAIVDDSTALLVEPTADGLARGIISVLTDEGLSRRLSESAAAYARDRLSWQAFVAFIETLLHSLPRPNVGGFGGAASPKDVFEDLGGRSKDGLNDTKPQTTVSRRS